MEKISTQIPKAASPRRCMMNGERKMPTTILIPRENQLDPTFFRTCNFSILRMWRANYGFSWSLEEEYNWAITPSHLHELFRARYPEKRNGVWMGLRPLTHIRGKPSAVPMRTQFLRPRIPAVLISIFPIPRCQ